MPEIAGITGAPGALATCPAKTAAVMWAKIATAAFPPAPVYSQTIPMPFTEDRIGPLSEAPIAASTWVNVGHLAAPVVTAGVVIAVLPGAAVVAGEAVVADGAMVVDDVELAPLPLLPDPQPVTANPAITTPAQRALLVTPSSIDPALRTAAAG